MEYKGKKEVYVFQCEYCKKKVYDETGNMEICHVCKDCESMSIISLENYKIKEIKFY